MEKTAQLQQIDGELCQYFQRYNDTKKSTVFCYSPDKQQISDFYNRMGDHFLTRNIDRPEKTVLKSQSKLKQRITTALKNPLQTALPRQIEQSNTTNMQKKSIQNNNFQPMYSEVECSKKKSYVIGEEVRTMVNQDIQEMVKQKQERLFRKKFPAHKVKSKSQLYVYNIQTEDLIKKYNRMLAKYKNQPINMETNLKMLQYSLFSGIDEDIALDGQILNLLGLFKKLYFETKSQKINENLLKYVLKFQKEDKMIKKIRTRKVFSSKKHSRHNSSVVTFQQSSNQVAKSSKMSLSRGSSSPKKQRISILTKACNKSNKPFQAWKKARGMGENGAKLSRFDQTQKQNIKKRKLKL